MAKATNEQAVAGCRLVVGVCQRKVHRTGSHSRGQIFRVMCYIPSKDLGTSRRGDSSTRSLMHDVIPTKPRSRSKQAQTPVKRPASSRRSAGETQKRPQKGRLSAVFFSHLKHHDWSIICGARKVPSVLLAKTLWASVLCGPWHCKSPSSSSSSIDKRMTILASQRPSDAGASTNVVAF